jgi:hypothetical protein
MLVALQRASKMSHLEHHWFLFLQRASNQFRFCKGCYNYFVHIVKEELVISRLQRAKATLKNANAKL